MNDQHIKKQVWIIALVTFLSFFALTMPIPILTVYFLKQASLSHWTNNKVMLYLVLGLYPLGGFISTPIIGWLSDEYGRKSVLMFCLAAASIVLLFSGISIAFNTLYIVLLRLLSGIFEGNSALAYSAISDLFKDNRKKYFGKINAALTLGWTLGPVMGGVLSEHHLSHYFSLALPFYIASVLHAFALLLTCFYFKQGSPEKRESKTKHNNKLKLTNTKTISYLIFISFIITLGVDIIYQYMPVFSSEISKIGVIEIGVVTSVISLSKIIGNLYVINFMTRYVSEFITITLGAVMSILSLMFIIFSQSIIIVFISLPLLGISIAFMVTNLLSLVSHSATQENQGKTLGFMMSARTLGTALLFGLFSLSQYYFPHFRTLPLICSIAFFVLGLFLLYVSVGSNSKQLATAENSTNFS